MGSDVRIPLVAGMFYPGDRSGLRSMFESWQIAPVPERDGISANAMDLLRKPLGAIVPHAGYLYSGRVAAQGIRWLASHGRPERIVILGADHTGMGVGICTDDHDAWRTPLGDAPIDDEGRTALADAGQQKYLI